jgi:hypothetical protein
MNNSTPMVGGAPPAMQDEAARVYSGAPAAQHAPGTPTTGAAPIAAPRGAALPHFWEPQPQPATSTPDQLTKGMEDYRKAKEAELEAAKLRAFGGSARKAGTPLIGAGGLKLLTDDELQSIDSQVWLLKHVIPDAGFGTMYGDSGTFKSFAALDLLAAIARGSDKWFGYRVKQAPCVYVPFEGKGGIPKRVAAWRFAMAMRNTTPNNGNLGFSINFDVTTGITFVTDPLNLRNEEDRKKLVEALKAAGLAGGVMCIDTLAQAGAGIDENSSEGMGEMVRIFQELQRELGGVVLVVHHTGKDPTKGMRGHSSLRAALDFAIEFRRLDSCGKYEAVMELDKVKDEESGAVIPFRMQRVHLGVDDDGDYITSLVVLHEEPNPNMPEVTTLAKGANDVQQDADDERFVYEWVKSEVADGKFPSANSLQGQLAEMKQQGRVMTQKRVRDAIARLKAKSLLVTDAQKSPSGNPWLRAVDRPTTEMTT